MGSSPRYQDLITTTFKDEASGPCNKEDFEDGHMATVPLSVRGRCSAGFSSLTT